MRKILGLLIGLVFVCSLVLATSNPLPIAGTFKGLNVPVDVQITNLRTGVKVTERTNENDELVYDWLNSPGAVGANKFESSDQFEIRVLICDSSPNCVKKTYFSGGMILVNFDLTAENLPCPECELPVCEVCETCQVCPSPSSYCGEIDDICPDEMNSYCEAMSGDFCPECEEATWGSILTYILILIGGLGAGAGVQYTITRNKAGKVSMKATKHKHEGIEAYHSIYTLHTNKLIQHPKGCIRPIFENGRYVRCD